MKDRLIRVLVVALVAGQPWPVLAQAPGRFSTMTITSTASDALKVGTASLADTDLAKIDGITNGTAAASKAVVVDANRDVTNLRNVTATGMLVTPELRVNNTGLRVFDTNASHLLTLAPGSDLSDDRTLTITTGDAARTLTLSGNPTLSDWFDQSVKVAASPTFAAITIGSTAISETDIAKIDGITNGTAAASKALVADANIDIGTIRNLTVTGYAAGPQSTCAAPGHTFTSALTTGLAGTGTPEVLICANGEIVGAWENPSGAAGTSNYLLIQRTIPTLSAQFRGIDFSLTAPAVASSAQIRTLFVALSPGAAGSSSLTIAGDFSNSTTTTGASRGVSATALAAGINNTGDRYGVHGQAGNGLRNYGVLGYVNNGAAATTTYDIGVAGTAEDGGSATRAGGYFAIGIEGNSGFTPAAGVAALMADNTTVAESIFKAFDNGSLVFTIADGGAVTSTSTGQFTALGVNTAPGASGTITVPTTGELRYGANSRILNNGDGILQIMNNAANGFSRLQFGGTTSSFPAITRSGTALFARLADESNYAPFSALNYYASGGAITAGSATGLTVNSAGALQRQVYKVTLAKEAFVCAAVTCDVTIGTLPAKTNLVSIYADLTTTFACTATCTTATLTFQTGTTAGGVELLAGFDADAAISFRGDADAELGTVMVRASAIQGGVLPSPSGTQIVNVRLVSGTGNIGNGSATNLSQGSVTFYLVTERLP